MRMFVYTQVDGDRAQIHRVDDPKNSQDAKEIFALKRATATRIGYCYTQIIISDYGLVLVLGRENLEEKIQRIADICRGHGAMLKTDERTFVN